MDPYILLNLVDALDSGDCSDTVVKAAYLAATRAYPPEHYPEIFEAVREAYESIATQDQRLKHELFTLKAANPAALLYSCLNGLELKTVSEPLFRQMLKNDMSAFIKDRVLHE